MRRALHAAALTALLLAPAAAWAGDGTTMLGGDGELYRVKSGTYGSLFANAPANARSNPVLALDVERNGKSKRLLVPGTDGPELEKSPALTVDGATNDVYLVWAGMRGYHSVLDLIGYSEAGGFGEPFEFSGDVFSTKTNPQLATARDTYRTFSADGEVVTATRTILHLVWFDDGGPGQRALYTPVIIADGALLRTNFIFDLQELAGGDDESSAQPAPASLREKPEIRRGRDGQSVVVGFVTPATARLLTVELRSVTGELVSFGDKARSTIIDLMTKEPPGASRRAIADKARSTIIDLAKNLFRNEVARFLTQTFLDSVVQADEALPMDQVADRARTAVIETGAALRRGIADKAASQVIEIGQSDVVDSDSINHLLDVRPAARRELPAMSSQTPRMFVSQTGDDAALAWQADGNVQYRESTGDGGWGPVQTLKVGTALSVDDAYGLVQQRVGSK
ncbi:MAG TPA: hypothetical protein VN923_07910 [Thermoanaerobaculia bacterium]|nr:hypothetical protein [Thermoanaerobaculia bacterium]